MKKLLLLLCLLACKDTSNQQNECPSISVRFSPKGGITKSMVDSINNANDEVKIQAFSFTSSPIGNALIEAHKRGISIISILDTENLYNKNSAIKSLYAAGLTIYIDDRHSIAHNKIIIVDRNQVFTGSFNLSKSAEESNAENSILIKDTKIANIYLENWNNHLNHSHLYHPDN